MKPLLPLLLALSAAARPDSPCLTDPEAEALASVALPELIRQAGLACAAALPPASPLRRQSGPWLAQYDTQAARAWPAARAAIVKLSNPTADALLQSQYARPLLASLIAPLIVGQIDRRDCPTLDRLVTSLQPLPAANTATAIVAALHYAQRVRAAGRNPVAELPLCRPEGR